MEIVPFGLLNREESFVDRGETLYYKSDYFLIKNYSGRGEAEDLIQKYVDDNKDSNIAAFSQYDMVFYKESAKTNPENLKKYPRDLDRYSKQHDLLFDFRWRKGDFLTKIEYKDGQMLGTEEIIIKEVTDSLEKLVK